MDERTVLALETRIYRFVLTPRTVQIRIYTRSPRVTEWRELTVLDERTHVLLTGLINESQEEVYVLLNGPGHDVDEAAVDVPEGGMLQLPADIPRKFVNETDEEQRWLMVGAQPLGTVDDLDEFVMVEE